MRTSLKNIISLVLAFMLVFTLQPTPLFAASEDHTRSVRLAGSEAASSPDVVSDAENNGIENTDDLDASGSENETSGETTDEANEENTVDQVDHEEDTDETLSEQDALSDDDEISALEEDSDETSIIVYDYAELKAALNGDNAYTTIYLGADITAGNTGITVNANKPFVIIDGSPTAGERYTFTQYQVSGTAYLIQVSSASSITSEVTLRNMNITGKNIYGVVSMNSALGNTTLTFENVDYTGPQPAYHRSGTVRFIGGTYTLTNEEMAEALHVEFGGHLTINNTATTALSILWLVSASSTFTVLEGADVTVTTKNYFIYGNIANATLHENSKFSLTSKWLGFSYAAFYVTDFKVEKGASLYINLNTTESYAALRVSNKFEMAEGSSATIIRTGTAGIPLRLTAANAQAIFDRPERVFFYSSAGVPMRFTGVGKLSIATAALNVWAKTSWPLAGGVETMPTHIWNKSEDELLTITGTYQEMQNTGLSHNLSADDPVISSLTSSTFNLEGSQLLAFGNQRLSVDIPAHSSPALTGEAVPGAELQATYVLENTQNETAYGVSDAATGRYSLEVSGGNLMTDSEATLISKASSLFMRKNTTVVDGGQYTLSFVSVPSLIDFGQLSIPETNSLMQRQEEFHISVEDTRTSTSPWHIAVNLSETLSTEIGDQRVQLTDAIVFKTTDGQILPVNEVPQKVFTHNSNSNGVFELRWGIDEGVLLDLAPGSIYSNTPYTATLQWTLVDAP